MDEQENYLMLARRIAAILKDGIDLGPDMAHFIDSTFNHPTLKDLQAILDDESNCERDSLEELIVFPDESVQMTLEDFITQNPLTPEDQGRAVDALLALVPVLPVRLWDRVGRLNMILSHHAAEQLILRLNIGCRLTPELLQAVEQLEDEKDRRRCRVRLRNARCEFSPERIDFIRRVLSRRGTLSDDLFIILDFVLGLFDEFEAHGDIYAALMKKKRFYLRSLQKAAQFEEHIRHNNMETLMLQGVRAPLCSREDTLVKMGLIDRISMTVFGKTEFYGQPAVSMRIGPSNGNGAIDEMIKRLF